MIKKILFSFIVLLLTVGMSGSVSAQMNDSRLIDNLRMFLEANVEILERAQEAVRSAQNPIAERILVEAINLQDKAVQLFEQTQYQSAFSFGKQARQKAKDAMAVAGQAIRSDAVVLQRLENAAEHLQQAGEQVAMTDRQEIRAIFQVARDNLDRAWEFYRNGQYRPALKLADQIDNATRRLLSLHQDRQRSRRQFEQRLKQVQDMMERAEGQAEGCDSEQAEKIYERAGEALERAVQLAEKDHPLAAVNALKTAHSLTMKALKFCQSDDQLENRYNRLRAQAERLQERIEQDGGNEQIGRLLDQALDQLDMAREYWERGDIEPATAALQAAQLALRQVKRYIDKNR